MEAERSALDYLLSEDMWTPAGYRGENMDTAECPPTSVIESARAELSALRARVAELEAALRFYADPIRYSSANQFNRNADPYSEPDAPFIQDVTRDGGSIARNALTPKDPRP